MGSTDKSSSSHTGTKTTGRRNLFSCPVCQYVSSRLFNVRRHQRRIHNVTKKQLVCCGELFPTKWAFYEHLEESHPNQRKSSLIFRTKYTRIVNARKQSNGSTQSQPRRSSRIVEVKNEEAEFNEGKKFRPRIDFSISLGKIDFEIMPLIYFVRDPGLRQKFKSSIDPSGDTHSSDLSVVSHNTPFAITGNSYYNDPIFIHEPSTAKSSSDPNDKINQSVQSGIDRKITKSTNSDYTSVESSSFHPNAPSSPPLVENTSTEIYSSGKSSIVGGSGAPGKSRYMKDRNRSDTQISSIRKTSKRRLHKKPRNGSKENVSPNQFRSEDPSVGDLKIYNIWQMATAVEIPTSYHN